jgi:hypothetical protein
LLVEPEAAAKVVGAGPVYFLTAGKAPKVWRRKTPLQMTGLAVHRAPFGTTFNVKSWKGTGGDKLHAFNKGRRGDAFWLGSRNLLGFGQDHNDCRHSEWAVALLEVAKLPRPFETCG